MLKKIIVHLVLLTFIFNTFSCAYLPTFVKPLDKEKVEKRGYFYTTKPVKAHLQDGSLVVYKSGFEAVADTIITTGKKYDISRHNPEIIEKVPLQQVAVLEYYTTGFDFPAFIVSLPGVFMMVVLIAVMLNAPNM